jgi:predicted DNA binding CopG/RHH family protein
MEGKNERIYIRVSAEELEQIKEKAAARHLAVSAYIRMIVLQEKEVQHD